MALYITLASIIAFCVIIALIRIGIIAEYDEHGFVLWLKIAAFKIELITPGEKKPEKAKKETEKKGGNLDTFMSLMPDIKDLLSRLKKRLTINILAVHITAAAKDPASAALMFGGAHTALGIIVPLIDNNFNVKKRSIDVQADFTIPAALIYMKAHISAPAGTLIALAVHFVPKFSRTMKKAKEIK